MLRATVDEAAKQFNVAPKTIREWMRYGMPVHKEGGKGAGNGAIIDMARAPNWVAEERQLRPPRWAEYFNGLEPEMQNPFRAVAERFFSMSVDAIAAAAVNWYSEPKTSGKLAWRELGLTDKQARGVVWDMWAHASLFLLVGKLERFDSYVATMFSETNGKADLDDLASLFLCGDINSEWNPNMEMPERIRPFAPQSYKERAAKRLRKSSKAHAQD